MSKEKADMANEYKHPRVSDVPVHRIFRLGFWLDKDDYTYTCVCYGELLELVKTGMVRALDESQIGSFYNDSPPLLSHIYAIGINSLGEAWAVAFSHNETIVFADEYTLPDEQAKTRKKIMAHIERYWK